MEVQLTPDQETRLDELAGATGRGRDELIREAIDHMLSYNIWFKEQVRKGLDELDRGEFIEDDEVKSRMARMFHS